MNDHNNKGGIHPCVTVFHADGKPVSADAVYGLADHKPGKIRLLHKISSENPPHSRKFSRKAMPEGFGFRRIPGKNNPSAYKIHTDAFQRTGQNAETASFFAIFHTQRMNKKIHPQRYNLVSSMVLILSFLLSPCSHTILTDWSMISI